MVKFIEFSDTKPCFNQVFSGIQLLPYQYTKYVIPFDKEMIASRIWEYFLVDCFGNRTNITDSCKKVGNTIEIDRIQYDLDRRVYIEIRGRLVFESSPRIYYYSNVFKVSSYDKDRTTRIDYKCKESDTLFSIQVQIFEDHDLRQIELKNYNQILTRRSVSYVAFNAKYSVFRSKIMYIETLNKIQDLFSNTFVYFNFEQVNMFTPPDISSPEPDTYMIEANFEITKLGESIGPIYVLGVEGAYQGCYIEFTQNIDNKFTVNKQYPEYTNNGVEGIDDNVGIFHSKTTIFADYPNTSRGYCIAVAENTAITTENNKLIQIENGR